jgi:hypothetical protein
MTLLNTGMTRDGLFLIENGEIAGPVHVGEAYDFPGTALVPAMKIEDVRMTSISDQQREFTAAQPGTFVPAKGAWGRSGCTLVQLAAADRETVGEAMTLAWQGTVKAATARAKSKKRSR